MLKNMPRTLHKYHRGEPFVKLIKLFELYLILFSSVLNLDRTSQPARISFFQVRNSLNLRSSNFPKKNVKKMKQLTEWSLENHVRKRLTGFLSGLTGCKLQLPRLPYMDKN